MEMVVRTGLAGFLYYRCLTFQKTNAVLGQGCTNPKGQVVRTTKFCRLVSNIFVP
jgi:hypothetical protein